MHICVSFTLASVLGCGVLARNVPDNVRNFYNKVQPGTCSGADLLQGGFFDTVGSPPDWAYCQQGVAGQAIFIKGHGTFANMDIDCDGDQADPNNDGRCNSSTDTQGQTTFQDTVETYGIPDLDAYIHPYVVFGNQGNYSPTFNPQQYGVEPLSVMAVVCGDQLIYAVWGDTNGDDGPPLVGEASLATGTLCYGDVVNGNNGYDGTDVFYIAFTGQDAVPGKSGAAWETNSTATFEASIQTLGDTLIARLTVPQSSSPSGGVSRGLMITLVPILLCWLGDIFWAGL